MKTHHHIVPPQSHQEIIMSFIRMHESTEDEVARLRSYGPSGDFARWADQEVVNEFPRTEQIIELRNPCRGDENYRIFVRLEMTSSWHGTAPRNDKGLVTFTRNYAGVIVASTHPSYPVGGHRLSIPEAEARRSRVVALEELLLALPTREA